MATATSTPKARVNPENQNLAILINDYSSAPYMEVNTGRWLSEVEVKGWTEVLLAVPKAERQFQPGDMVDIASDQATVSFYLPKGGKCIRIGKNWYGIETDSYVGRDDTIRAVKYEYLYNVLTDDLVLDDDDCGSW